ncbi:hypothetical protein AB0P21_08685 [Kribbella sp. NPDC056861]|uniref:hypothetical protein n=1 Tax=Kribbella sp. NPDC056861 TaxID=3154857 RepID=UPI003444A243
MTKYLEERLSEALDAAARTVPDNAVPPELFPAPPAERRWAPVLAIGVAMAAVVTAVAIPLVIAHNRTAPATGVCPASPTVSPLTYEKRQYPGAENAELNKLPFGGPPRVPFTMTRDLQWNGRYLEDLGVRVPLADGQVVYSLGRISCGWVVSRKFGKEVDEAGVLTTDGKYRSLGTVTGDTASLSPDGSQLAYLTPAAEVVTVSVATGKRLAATQAGSNTEILGWNSHGVWFMPDRDKSLTQLWRPGNAPVSVETGDHHLTAYRGTDRMLLSEGANSCVRVVTLEGGKLNTLLEKCGGTSAALSPDGRLLIAENGPAAQGYLVETGAKTAFTISSTILTPDYGAIWEDSTHFIQAAGLATDRQLTLRCDVVSGACERIQDGPQGPGSLGPDLGYP